MREVQLPVTLCCSPHRRYSWLDKNDGNSWVFEVLFGPRHSANFCLLCLIWFSTLPYKEGPTKKKRLRYFFLKDESRRKEGEERQRWGGKGKLVQEHVAVIWHINPLSKVTWLVELAEWVICGLCATETCAASCSCALPRALQESLTRVPWPFGHSRIYFFVFFALRGDHILSSCQWNMLSLHGLSTKTFLIKSSPSFPIRRLEEGLRGPGENNTT